MNKGLKIVLVFVFALFSFSMSFGQDKAGDSTIEVEAYAKQQTVIYRLAKYFGDSEVARSALYNLISLNTENPRLLDTLALEYYEDGQWLSAALVGQEVIKLNQDDVFALEIAASAMENLGAKDRALEYYESLYLKNEGISVLYKVGFLQYELKKFGEAKATSDALLSKSEAKELMIVFRKADKTQQEVSMEASVYNLKGLIAGQEGDKAESSKWFKKALEVSPEFELAKINLDNVNK